MGGVVDGMVHGTGGVLVPYFRSVVVVREAESLVSINEVI